MHARVDRVRKLLTEQALDGLLMHKPENRTYITGFTGSEGFAIVTARETLLLVDFRYVEQARIEAPAFEVIKAEREITGSLAEAVRSREVRRLGFESDGLTYQQYRDIAQKLVPTELVPVDSVDRLRWVKDADELARIRQAVAIGDAAFAHIQRFVRPGAVERDVAVELEFFMRRQDADKEAFETVVASGTRSALPHGRASGRTMQRGDLVTLDFGAVYRGYASDCTRTVVLGEPDARQRAIYMLVLTALQTALGGIRPGMRGKEADALARSVIADAGYAEAFGHSLGHGVGLAVHEGPRLSAREDAILEPGMVVTVEPGIYLTGWGGVRIEDLVVLTEHGCEVLTRAPRELMSL